MVLGYQAGVDSFSLTGLSPSMATFSKGVRLTNRFVTPMRLAPQPRLDLHQTGLGCSRFARRYSGNRICFLFHRVLRWFTSPGCLLAPYFTQERIPRFHRGGFPHSEIRGSTLACSYPRLIAAYHVLHRLLAPRHPPYALTCLTINYNMVRNKGRYYPSSLYCQRPYHVL